MLSIFVLSRNSVLLEQLNEFNQTPAAKTNDETDEKKDKMLPNFGQEGIDTTCQTRLNAVSDAHCIAWCGL